MNRKSFRENLFFGKASQKTESVEVTVGRTATEDNGEVQAGVAVARDAPRAPSKMGGKADFDFGTLDLNGAKLADAPSTVSSSDIPTAKAPSSKAGASLGGG